MIYYRVRHEACKGLFLHTMQDLQVFQTLNHRGEQKPLKKTFVQLMLTVSVGHAAEITIRKEIDEYELKRRTIYCKNLISPCGAVLERRPKRFFIEISFLSKTFFATLKTTKDLDSSRTLPRNNFSRLTTETPRLPD